ncbi:exonuclease domain-containing protein [uncultured Pseudomonas sp.]|uniref:exonuclease domain-containing protein n=1 Tax=uncultured Pseudomonas sp. TaxID=114707 RepID=UPI002585BE39|nr:exonuclease domain-containing protein [uncultured Pseudomonas sp.]
MKHWLVLDLEATTDEGGWPLELMEIIEIGAVMVDAEGQELGRYQSFVQPRRLPLLTPFCRDLTHISQADVDGAEPLESTWPAFEAWLGAYETTLAGWCSWGDFDRRLLERAWREHDLHTHLARVPHRNLKQAFAKARGLARPLGLTAALESAGLAFTGMLHRAETDARNTAKLLPASLPAFAR